MRKSSRSQREQLSCARGDGPPNAATRAATATARKAGPASTWHMDTSDCFPKPCRWQRALLRAGKTKGGKLGTPPDPAGCGAQRSTSILAYACVAWTEWVGLRPFHACRLFVPKVRAPTAPAACPVASVGRSISKCRAAPSIKPGCGN